MRQLFTLFLVICCMWSGSALAQDNSQPNGNSGAGPAPDERSLDPLYVIGPEDELQITVWREPELTTRATVRPDGKIGFQLLNDIQASGLTPMQLQKNITEGLAKYVNDPQVSVIVLQIRSLVVYVTGAVNAPGMYPLGGPMTIMELLVRAGGLAEFAKADRIFVVRKQGDKQVQIPFNYKHFMEGKDYDQNIQLKSGDMVIVPS